MQSFLVRESCGEERLFAVRADEIDVKPERVVEGAVMIFGMVDEVVGEGVYLTVVSGRLCLLKCLEGNAMNDAFYEKMRVIGKLISIEVSIK